MRLTKKVTKVFYLPHDEDKGWVKIKHLKSNELRKIESKANKLSFNTGAEGAKIDFDPYTRTQMVAHACIEEWGNMYNVNGKPMKRSAVNVDKAAEFEVIVDGEKMDFFGWIEQCREELAQEVEEQTGPAEEN